MPMLFFSARIICVKNAVCPLLFFLPSWTHANVNQINRIDTKWTIWLSVILVVNHELMHWLFFFCLGQMMRHGFVATPAYVMHA